MTSGEHSAQFARDLKRRREAFGLTQEAVASAVGVSTASISNWEKGVCMPRAYTVDLLRTFWRSETLKRERAGLAQAVKPAAAPSAEVARV